MPALDAPARALLEGKNFCTISTLRADGSVQANVVWVDTDGEHVVVNSAEGRNWPANLDRDPRCTCTVPAADNPYEYVSIRGVVDERSTYDADEHIDKLAQKYIGQDTYPFRQPGEKRVIIRIRPEDVFYQKQG